MTRFAAGFPQPWPPPYRERPELPPLLATVRDSAGVPWRVVERREEYVTLRSGGLVRMVTRERFAEWAQS